MTDNFFIFFSLVIILLNEFYDNFYHNCRLLSLYTTVIGIWDTAVVRRYEIKRKCRYVDDVFCNYVPKM